MGGKLEDPSKSNADPAATIITTPPSHHAFFVSIHIPKSAGTTLASIFDRVYRRRVLFDYPSMDEIASPDPLFDKHKDFVSSYFKGIHGHFAATRYLPIFSTARYISCLRHPVKRIISQYQHEYYECSNDSIWHNAIRDGLDVVEFASLDEIRNASQAYLAGIEIEDYDLLLISERLDSSLECLNYVIGNMQIDTHFGSPTNYPFENKAERRGARLKITDAQRLEIYNRVPDEIDIYRRADLLLTKKLDRYL